MADPDHPPGPPADVLVHVRSRDLRQRLRLSPENPDPGLLHHRLHGHMDSGRAITLALPGFVSKLALILRPRSLTDWLKHRGGSILCETFERNSEVEKTDI